MTNSIEQFKITIQDIKGLTAPLDHLENSTTGIIDISDLRRSPIVLAISALDYFIHELVREEMLQIFKRNRPIPKAFKRFPIPVSAVLNGPPSEEILSSHIRQKHSWMSFQDPDKIAEAIRLVSDKKLWEEVAPAFDLTAGDIKIKLKLIVDRRNKIAHEADFDPSYPNRKWDIDSSQVNDVIDFVDKLAQEIFQAID